MRKGLTRIIRLLDVASGSETLHIFYQLPWMSKWDARAVLPYWIDRYLAGQ